MADNAVFMHLGINRDECGIDFASEVVSVSFRVNGQTVHYHTFSDVEDSDSAFRLADEGNLIATTWLEILNLAGSSTGVQPLNPQVLFAGWDMSEGVWPILTTKAIHYAEAFPEMQVARWLTRDPMQKWHTMANTMNVEQIYLQGRSPVKSYCRVNPYQTVHWLEAGSFVEESLVTPDLTKGADALTKIQKHLESMEVLCEKYYERFK